MRTLTITITGKTDSDLICALEEVTRLVGEEFTSGMNSNDEGSFTFDITGEEVEKKLYVVDQEINIEEMEHLFYVANMEDMDPVRLVNMFNENVWLIQIGWNDDNFFVTSVSEDSSS